MMQCGRCIQIEASEIKISEYRVYPNTSPPLKVTKISQNREKRYQLITRHLGLKNSPANNWAPAKKQLRIGTRF